MRSDSDTDSGTLPPPSTNEKKALPPSSGSYSAGTTTEKEWTKHEDAADQETRMNDEVLQLARRYTTQSNAAPGSLFPVPAEGPLNPSSPDFNARKWAKAFYNIRTDTSEGNPPKTTGIAFKNLNVFGYGTSTDYQKSVGNVFLEAASLVKKLTGAKEQRIDILHDLEGVVHSGEMLAVLGPRPGPVGIQPKDMRTAFRGEAIYTAEVDEHFAHLTVGDTLYFAARARCPKNIPEGISRREYVEHLRDVTMAMFGIHHTKNTRVGDDFVRGVSGGERKRVTIAEAALSYSPLQCWDNSTRGLDSANALEFCRTLRTQADTMGCTSCVAIYQASQDAYDVFDKVVVLYEGRQIYFGKTTEAQAYFEGLGFICPEQQTTADFLTSMTSHQERVIRPGWEGKTPRSPDDFARAWKASQHRARLLEDVEDYLQRHPFGGEHYQNEDDSEGVAGMEKQTSVFHWKDVCYDIKIKGEPRRILDHVDGRVKPGTLTALMGVSGAGKTTLLDVLATRVTVGVISGDMLVNGQPRDDSFQRKTGYVQQQDLHLHTSTVREALNFSALLRQPANYTRKEKLEYVDTVIGLLGMEEYSDAVIGVPGEGLNVEQRKRLTIDVEFAARPQLLLLLDEPTSGLDSQTSWSICNLMEKLTKSGQAILCTIHQPSAMLFQRFDRLILLARGGRTVYFREIGKNSQTLVDYFVRNGGLECPPGANPAEYMLEVIGAAPGAHTDIDWPAVWRQTPEYQSVQYELTRLCSGGPARPALADGQDQSTYKEFAAGFSTQILAGPNDLPGFWIFMYRVNPFTYVVEGFLGTSLANAAVHCASNEFVSFAAPSGQTCGQYMSDYISAAGGYLSNPDAVNGAEECQYCAVSDTNTFLKGINVDFDHRWRNFGLMWAYCIFNIVVAALVYWLVRMPKNKKVKKE
ncbi:P-loop containing nucleoside triphosphate hydrolase protein [Colletotrichum phormii]|uniref:P-loop containing nucleoside triphosphate hydrolase protein n=1 Tax=Colletotrichum phormii TaxID=359342 RepID=A0AAI9ZPG6_9PEZI|nr:P-loop containing nucleoside triphosphate hydrolase protein [Colletotrichum phormii]KAK1634653.1 P-loop containing nucleoside triphosphate hydrolase protein [Colletotrichum phormii]